MSRGNTHAGRSRREDVEWPAAEIKVGSSLARTTLDIKTASAAVGGGGGSTARGWPEGVDDLDQRGL